MTKCTITNKVRFRTQNDADKAVTEIKKNPVKRGKEPVRSYYCDRCQGYHLTSKEMERTAHPVVLRFAKLFNKFIIN
jgi:hypothetical protein